MKNVNLDIHENVQRDSHENKTRRYDRHYENNQFTGGQDDHRYGDSSNRTYGSHSYARPDGRQRKKWASHNPNMYDNHNKNVRNYRDSEFFHQDWPTPMEAEILRKLRDFIQMESNNWGPARW